MRRSTAPSRLPSVVATRFAATTLLAVMTACGSTPKPKDTRVTGVAPDAPGEFQDMRSLLVKVGRLRDANDAVGARALFPEVLREGKGLLLMPGWHSVVTHPSREGSTLGAGAVEPVESNG